MTRLPTVGGDDGTWGTTLNDYLTSIAAPVSALASATSAGDTTITMTQTPLAAMNSRASLVAIDVGSVNCEVMAVSSISGSVLTFTAAMKNAHSSGVPLVWLMDGEAPMSFWGAKGDNSTDDTLAVQAAINQSLQPVWVTGNGRFYVITRPLIFPDGCHVRRVGKFKASSGSWLGTPESTNAMGMSCQDVPVTFTATASDNTLTCVSNHNSAVGNKVTLTGSSLPSPLIQGRVYFVKTTASSTKMTLALTSGGAEIDLTTDGSGTVYPDVNALERVYLDDVLFDGGGVASLNGFLYASQQPGEWSKVRFTSFPGFGLHVGGQSGHFRNLEIDSCGTGIVLSDVFGATHMKFYDVQLVNNTVRGINVTSGAVNCAFYGLWIENNVIGIDVTGLSYGMVFDALQTSQSTVTWPIVKVHVGSSNSGSFDLRGTRFSSSTQLVIDDVDRGFQLTAADFDSTQLTLGMYSQPGGANAPVVSKNQVRSVSTTPITLNLADNVLLCDATSASITVNLPSAGGIAGKRYAVKKTDASANTVTLDGAGAETIDGAATKVLSSQYASVEIVSNGSNWMIV